ncbi:MAG: class I SAM-dependent methyltransferase [bacterium]|nr:class I SAM-dependent methyltransferase [bacterium]
MTKKVPPKFYDSKYYYQQCEGFPEFFEGKISKRFNPLYGLIGKLRNETVLDIGCGRGEISSYCVQRGSKAYGIDYSKDAIKIAKKTFNKVNFKIMDASKLQFKDHFFDKIILLDFVEHIYPKELLTILEEVKRVIKPNGIIIIHTPNLWFSRILQIVGYPFGYKESDLHVNLQSYFQLKNNLKVLNGDIKFHFIRRKNYFFEISVNIRKLNLSNLLVRIIDYLFELNFIAKIIHSRPLAYFLEPDFWVTVKI